MSNSHNDTKLFMLIGLLVALVLAGYGYWFFSTHEKIVEIERGRYSKEARKDDYLAWKRYLSRTTGANVDQLKSITSLDPTLAENSVFFSPRLQGQLTTRDREHLMLWLESGGHLITVVWTLWDEEDEESGDPFLDQLGIKQSTFSEDPVTNEPQAIDVSALGEQAPITIAFDPYYVIDASGDHIANAVSDDNGTHLVQVKVGKGLATVLTDDSFWLNWNIENDDNAYLAWLLANQRPAQQIWFYDEFRATPLTDLLWQHGWPALISLFISIPLMLWALFNRFGPLQRLHSTQQRSMLEHLLASGRFHWQQKKPDSLLQPVRQQITRKARRHVPQWSDWSEAQQIDWLHELSQLEHQHIHELLHASPTKEREVVQLLQHLQKLEHQL